MVDRLDCTVMPYAWGSRTAIADLTGRASPSSEPEAELWMGAHPMAPSKVQRGGEGVAARSLAEILTEDPEGELGAESVARFGARLPFLFKVLAAAEPLSLQAHPTEARARAGYADEEARAVPRTAGHRNYKDPSHKPELLCALTPFDALCGFRRADDTRALFDRLAVPALDTVLAPLRDRPERAAKEALGEVFRLLMTMSEPARIAAVDAAVARCVALAAETDGPFAREYAWAVRLAKLYPGDAGVVGALLLNLVHLRPGEAIYLDAGNLHAYLDGVGIEIMASSDNVLRGGLTKKHVDVPELMAVLDFADGPVPIVQPERLDDDEDVWRTPSAEFRLSRLRLGPSPITRAVAGPEIVLCTEGSMVVEGADGSAPVVLARGQSAFVGASTRHYAARAGAGEKATAFRATVNV